VGVMSQLRSHLKVRSHRGFPEIVAHCSRCQQDFVEVDVYDIHKGEGCEPQPRIRNDMVLTWGRLYVALYPTARRIPVPWTDETGWLTDSEEHRCRAPFANPVTSSPFLERHQSRDSSHPQTPPAIVNPRDDPAYDIVMDFLLSDALDPMLVQSNHSTAATPNPSRQDEASLHASYANAAASGAQHWPDILQDLSTQKRTIQHGATYYTTDQRLSAARECEFMYQTIMAMHEARSLQPTQTQIDPVVAQPSTATDSSNSMDTAPSKPQYLAFDEYTVSTASIQPSTQEYNTVSSYYMNSTPTQSSTSHPRFLHPFSSNYSRYRRSSVPNSPIPETLAMRRLSSRFSLPDEDLNDDDDVPYRAYSIK
jgi:hypothetical protein